MTTAPAFYCPHCRRRKTARGRAEDVFDEPNHRIIVADESRYVRPRDWQILAILRERQGVPVGVEAFYQLIWEAETDDPPFVEQNIRVHVCRLRQLLAGSGWRITTLWGFGYKLEREKHQAPASASDRPAAQAA